MWSPCFRSVIVDAAVVVSDGVLSAAAAVDLVDLLVGVVVGLALVGFVASPGSQDKEMTIIHLTTFSNPMQKNYVILKT